MSFPAPTESGEPHMKGSEQSPMRFSLDHPVHPVIPSCLGLSGSALHKKSLRRAMGASNCGNDAAVGEASCEIFSTG